MEEMLDAVRKTKAGKAAGVDGIPPDILKAALWQSPPNGEPEHNRFRDILLALLNAILNGGDIPEYMEAVVAGTFPST